MTNFLNKTKSILVGTTLAFTCVWIVFALSFQVFAIYLTASGQDDRLDQISNEITWKIDGNFKNNPDNIWYEGPAK